MIPYKQLSLNDIFTDCQDKFENDKPAFLSLLEEHIDLDKIIPNEHILILLHTFINIINYLT